MYPTLSIFEKSVQTTKNYSQKNTSLTLKVAQNSQARRLKEKCKVKVFQIITQSLIYTKLSKVDNQESRT